MIDKISGNGVYYPDQNKRKNAAVRAYENTPGTKETAHKKSAHKTSQADAPGSSESGVILDLSKKTPRQSSHVKEASQESFFAAAVRKLFAPVVQWLKNFWESDTAKPDQSQDADGLSGVQEIMPASESEETAADVTAAAQLADGETALPPLDAVAQAENLKALGEEAVKSGSIQKLEQFVTQNGTKHLAHNSDLLTYYDRSGKIVELDETEKHRVLFGDKNVLKL